jgi:hypothetical protein
MLLLRRELIGLVLARGRHDRRRGARRGGGLLGCLGHGLYLLPRIWHGPAAADATRRFFFVLDDRGRMPASMRASRVALAHVVCFSFCDR